jgi:hypothetical protein
MGDFWAASVPPAIRSYTNDVARGAQGCQAPLVAKPSSIGEQHCSESGHRRDLPNARLARLYTNSILASQSVLFATQTSEGIKRYDADDDPAEGERQDP